MSRSAFQLGKKHQREGIAKTDCNSLAQQFNTADAKVRYLAGVEAQQVWEANGEHRSMPPNIHWNEGFKNEMNGWAHKPVTQNRYSYAQMCYDAGVSDAKTTKQERARRATNAAVDMWQGKEDSQVASQANVGNVNLKEEIMAQGKLTVATPIPKPGILRVSDMKRGQVFIRKDNKKTELLMRVLNVCNNNVPGQASKDNELWVASLTDSKVWISNNYEVELVDVSLQVSK